MYDISFYWVQVLCLRIRRTPKPLRTDSLLPFTTLFRSLSPLQTQRGGDMGFLVRLRLFKAVVPTGEIGAAVLAVGVEEEIIEPVRQVVMMGDVLLRPHRVVQLGQARQPALAAGQRSEEHTSELQSLMSTSYAVFCLKTNKR